MTTSRRRFIASSGTALAAASGWPMFLPRRAEFDLVIRGGTIYDGTGAPGIDRDLGILAGRIEAIGQELRGREEIDARGMAVTPGFIDIHSHADGSLRDDPRGESAIRQGITTIIAGQDGGSRATGAAERSFTEYFTALDRIGPGPNVAAMVGLGTVRGAVVGSDDRPATPDELARMTALVEQALAQGACGASSGLEYTPGAFASLEELVALARPLRARGLPYATHMRNEDDRLLDSIDESIAVAAGAGCRLHISHLKTQGPRNWARLDDAFDRIERAVAAGGDVSFDRYPYLAYSTGLTNLFPVASRDGGTDAFLARLEDPAAGPAIREATLAKVELIGGWDNVQITSVRAEQDRGAEGRRLGAYAAERGADPYRFTVELLTRNGGSVGMVGFAMSEANLERILAHPLGMVCTDGGGFAIDGPTRRGSPHPRGIGSFPRVLGRYVRERNVMPLAEAVRKMTSLPASRVRLDDRGRLARGLAADVVVFDPARIADRATFEDPFQYATGIDAVVVNGVLTLQGGARRGSRGSGRALRPAAAT
ncbi:MAG TPA: D-aminoacylase [Gemmatimonadales bacterium]|nr:D-aminoacylase [Gemmatimonadales bacterium]